MPALADLIEQHANRTARGADDEVDVAVVVDVAERRAAAHVRTGERRTGSLGRVLEPPVPQVEKQLFALLQRERLAP